MTAMLATWLLPDLWRDYVQEPGREGVFLVLAAFLVSFTFIRTSARIARSPRFAWWPGSVVTDSGVHLHHLVWGIALMTIGGTLGFALADEPTWFAVSAILFGTGVGLTFDEFALWIHLRDVYWAHEGRSSIDAVAITASFMGLVFLGVNPLQFTGDDVLGTLVSTGYSLIVVTVSGVCFAKGRFAPGFVSLVLIPVGLWAAVRLAKPGSPWARWRYGARDPERQARATVRFGAHRPGVRIAEWLRHAIGGVVPPERPAPDEETRQRELDALVDARDELRAQVEPEDGVTESATRHEHG